MLTLREPQKVRFTYRNWKGETGERLALFLCVYYAANQYHPETQWLVDGYDLDKKVNRTFAMKDMSNVTFLWD